MARYHSTGTICKAQPGNCPLESNGEEHFNSKEEAMAYAEKKNASEFGNTITLQKNKSNSQPNAKIDKLIKKGNANFIKFNQGTPIKDKEKTAMFNAGKQKNNKFDNFKKGLYNNAERVTDSKIKDMFKVM